ncbi:MAG: hypothetical protein M1834_000989 [Cirrosporium novae-zelandiae]|nr:MAG: hypothetical protein M1834_000989 [Cirrosporium novae-zelandiae]
MTFVFAATAKQWRSRSIYQVVTDRYALTSGSTSKPCDPALGIYCGGTWKGLTKKLDYIKNMGFDAVWISPVTAQIKGTSLDLESYHGYWQNNIYKLNAHFGTAADLKALSKALHTRGMYLMVDVVVGDLAYKGAQIDVNYATLHPFNKKEYYHEPPCFVDWDGNLTNMYDCWLGDNVVSLPDLRTEDDDVSQKLYSWISGLVTNYSIDGLRVDSAGNINPEFWPGFLEAAGVFATFEFADTNYITLCNDFTLLPSVLNYPTYLTMTYAFNATYGSIANLAQEVTSLKQSCKDSTMMGSFSENHDLPRFASYTSDITLQKNVIAMTMLQDGIPIIYYGQEQQFDGAFNPVNREALWLSSYDTSTTLYKFITTLNGIRSYAFKHLPQYPTYKSEPLYYDSETLALRKGSVVTVLTNQGSNGAATTIMIDGTGYSSEAQLVEFLTCTKYTAQQNGSLKVTAQNGAPMVFGPVTKFVKYKGC